MTARNPATERGSSPPEGAVGAATIELEQFCAVEAPGVTHLEYRVIK